MSKPSAIQISAIKALDENLSIVDVTSLNTLPHSSVTRVILDNGQSVILKQAGEREFADKIRKELLINRNLVSQLAHKIGPTLLASDALGMNLPRYFANTYEIDAIREYVKTSGDCGLHQSEADVLERYRQCLLLAVIVSVGMKNVPGINDQVWSFLFINAVHSAIEHDALSFCSESQTVNSISLKHLNGKQKKGPAVMGPFTTNLLNPASGSG